MMQFHRSTPASTLAAISLLFITLFPLQANADYILTAPPRENPEAGKALYEPLARHLSSLLGQAVVYQHPGTWQAYEKNMRAGEYDIVFDGPHFIAWRIESLQARPLVRLPGALRFVLVANTNQSDATRPEDMVGKRICTLPSPHLGALSVFSMYPNPAKQPNFVVIKGGPMKIIEFLQSGRCEGAILAKFIYTSKMPAQARASLRILKESPALTNQGITISSRISAHERKLMVDSLTSGSGLEAARPVLERFSKKSSHFLPASEQDYAGQNLLHDNMIFGW